VEWHLEPVHGDLRNLVEDSNCGALLSIDQNFDACHISATLSMIQKDWFKDLNSQQRQLSMLPLTMRLFLPINNSAKSTAKVGPSHLQAKAFVPG